jgi:putative phosphoribosyl transferase
MNRFQNREDAGALLADALEWRGYEDPVVLALPRGGVPVAAIVAHRLSAPLDLIMVRKIGVPSQPELAAAAVVNGDDPQIVVNDEIASMVGLSQADIKKLAAEQLEEIKRRRALYLHDHYSAPLEGKTAIVIDDGIATGATARAALKGIRRRGPSKLVLAVPVAPEDTVARLKSEVDEIVCLETPRHFSAIGVYYLDFHQVPDSEVVRLLGEVQEESRPEITAIKDQ